MYVQDEGLAAVFTRLERAGATAVATTPKVAAPVAKDRGVRFPPLHVDGHARVVARPLWGKREQHLKYWSTVEAARPQPPGTPYRLTAPEPYPPEVGDVPRRIIEAAQRRGLEAHLQIQPFLPPQLRPEHAPVTVDGRARESPRGADSGCLNHPEMRAYALGLVEATLATYPEVDGLFIDWVEFGAYALEDLFTCFCPHCRATAESWGFDWPGMEADVGALWDRLHHLQPGDLSRAARLAAAPSALTGLLMRYPGALDLLRFKAATVTGFYREARERLDAAGHETVLLSARGWPPPWNRASGMHYHVLAAVCSAVTPKLFTFDYAALPSWYGTELLAWNPALSEEAVLDALVAAMDLPDEVAPRTLDAYGIPAPGRPHTPVMEAYRSRLEEVRDEVAGRSAFYPIAHAYLPAAQWEKLLTILREVGAEGLWVQMYGYLSDRKLTILRDAWG